MTKLKHAFGLTIITFQQIVEKSMSIFRWTCEKKGGRSPGESLRLQGEANYFDFC